MNPNASKPKIVVLGGGFGGLEAAYGLRSALPDRADITLISDNDQFLFKPNLIYVPFGMDERKLHVNIVEPARRKGIRFLNGRVRAIDPAQKTYTYELDGEARTELYDYLVVATGAALRPDEVPGMAEHARTIGTLDGMLRLRASLNWLTERARFGRTQEVLLALPAHAQYSTPLYEMTFLLDRWLRESNLRGQVKMTWVTQETSFMHAFGPMLHTLTEQHFDERRIAYTRGCTLASIEQGVAHFIDGGSIPFDLMITMPPGRASVPFPALPADRRGFIATQMATRRVTGLNEVFAVGDTTDFPIRQAFTALLQADAAAEGIAADIQGRAPRFVFEPMTRFVVDEFDTGVFAQAPFAADGGMHVELDNHQYRAGASPLWRIGKKMLGTLLPWRFSMGEPFGGGLPAAGLELGLKMMTGLMAARHDNTPAQQE